MVKREKNTMHFTYGTKNNTNNLGVDVLSITIWQCSVIVQSLARALKNKIPQYVYVHTICTYHTASCYSHSSWLFLQTAWFSLFPWKMHVDVFKWNRKYVLFPFGENLINSVYFENLEVKRIYWTLLYVTKNWKLNWKMGIIFK